MKELGSVGIGTGIHYPVPLHQQKAYAHLGYKTGEFPVTEKIAPEIVSLPMFPNLTVEQQARAIKAVAEFTRAKKVLAAAQ
jgi:dTDP-4-amino-4,6-dideoxygalactose transaminase